MINSICIVVRFCKIESHNCHLNSKVDDAPNQNVNFQIRQDLLPKYDSNIFFRPPTHIGLSFSRKENRPANNLENVYQTKGKCVQFPQGDPKIGPIKDFGLKSVLEN